jgi:hypothetical protein
MHGNFIGKIKGKEQWFECVKEEDEEDQVVLVYEIFSDGSQ